MKSKVNQQGFTLVELLMAFAAAAILVLSISSILAMPLRSLRINNVFAELRRDMTVAMAEMTRDVRASSYSETMDDTENSLMIPASAVQSDTIEYRFTPATGMLSRFVNGEEQYPVISEGLSRFVPVATNDAVSGLNGVLLYLEMQNDEADLTIINQYFIHSRN